MKGCRGCPSCCILVGDVKAELRMGEQPEEEDEDKAAGGGSRAEVGSGRLLGGTGAVGIIGNGGIDPAGVVVVVVIP